MAAIVDLDHIGVAVRDLDLAAAAYRRLGFRLTEKSEHVVPGPDGTLVPAGTGNHCFILTQGYVELIAVTRPGYTGGLLQSLAHHEGLHLVSVGAKSADDVRSLFERTTGAGSKRQLKRPFRESGRDFVAQFALVDPAAGSAPGINLFAIEHLTRDAIWQPQLCEHPNGATALVSVTLCATDADAYRARIAKVLDAPISGSQIVLTRGAIAVELPGALAQRFPGAALPPGPSAVAMTIAVRDLATAAAWLDSHGVASTRESARLWVAPQFAYGAIVEFVAA
jgi:catechol 2,3-dioxygenase-like lactoylglutathione lyase family enzyme